MGTPRNGLVDLAVDLLILLKRALTKLNTEADELPLLGFPQEHHGVGALAQRSWWCGQSADMQEWCGSKMLSAAGAVRGWLRLWLCIRLISKTFVEDVDFC